MPNIHDRKYSPPPTVNYRQLRLVDYFFKNGFKKIEAARMAGYAYPERYSNRLFKHPAVVAEIDKRRKKMSEKVQLTAEWIIEQLMAHAQAGLKLAKFRQLDGSWNFSTATPEELALVKQTQEVYLDKPGKGVKGGKIKLELPDSMKALEMLAKIQGMFKDTVEVTGKVELVDAINAGRKRIAEGEAE